VLFYLDYRHRHQPLAETTQGSFSTWNLHVTGILHRVPHTIANKQAQGVVQTGSTHAYTHNENREQSKKSGERKLLRSCRAALDVFRSVDAHTHSCSIQYSTIQTCTHTHTHTHMHTHTQRGGRPDRRQEEALSDVHSSSSTAAPPRQQTPWGAAGTEGV
jgi:hypothetical protein